MPSHRTGYNAGQKYYDACHLQKWLTTHNNLPHNMRVLNDDEM